MVIDFISLILAGLALWKGWKKGFVIAVCSVFAFFIGLIAALTFSAKVSAFFQSKGEHAFWLPFLIFTVIMTVTIFLVKLLASYLQKLLKQLYLGWLNRIAGILLYFLGYFSIYSIILFYASGISLISPTMISHSKTYLYIQPWGPNAVHVIGKIIPWFGDVLKEIRSGFEKIK